MKSAQSKSLIFGLLPTILCLTRIIVPTFGAGNSKFGMISTASTASCGDWRPYRDEKCFKIFEEFLTKNGPISHSEALALCKSVDATLPIIHSQDEQDFLSNFVFKESKMFDSIWLGSSQTDDLDFVWNDGSVMDYTNWMMLGGPKNMPDHCVQMEREQIGSISYTGKWRDVQCQRRNLVVCQKRQKWDLTHLLRVVVEQRQKIDWLINNPVPIGFIYTQYPMDLAPTMIWPDVRWADVTDVYAGSFFRALGGESADFGQIQPQNNPTIDRVKYSACKKWLKKCPTTSNNVTMTAGSSGGWSVPVVSGWSLVDNWNEVDYLSFHTAAGEVRPRNLAIKIFKRVA